MARPVELLLLRTIENLGIVGDIVKVRAGFARNYLLPHALAETPTPEKVEALKEARAKAQAGVAAQRATREATIAKLEGYTLKLVRSCNDQGLLYGSTTQRDISDALVAIGFPVDMRAVRLAAPFRRVGSYHCTIQFDRDLKAEINIDVVADRVLESLMRAQDADAAAAAEAIEEAKHAKSEETADAGAETKKTAKPKKGKKAEATA
ncbi:MAG: 50S ribosomal protein L9 [Phycisphaerales bacterium]|nr:50S ribosomal protein L9 [Phycisphaerales bacterium]